MLVSFLFFLRDKVVPYLFLLCIIIGGIGGIGWLFANTYFWNTSDMTVVVDEEILAAKIDIQARILYKDFTLFQDVYPFHIVLPASQEVSCSKECIFTDIPAGDAELILYSKSGTQQREKILILPDTKGVLDMRIPIRIQKVIPQDSMLNAVNGETIDIDSGIDSGGIFYKNTLQGLSLFYDKGVTFLYDTLSSQSVLIGNDLKVRAVVRGIEEGLYFLVTETNAVFLFDKYGRQKTEEIHHSVFGEQDIIWESRDGAITSKLIVQGKERIFPGRLFWFIYDQNAYLFDGESIFEIINN